MELLMWPAIASVLLGVTGWLVTSFFMKPLLDFLNLRSQVHEEVIFTANVGPMAAGKPIYDKAEESLRRLGAKVEATNATASRLLRCYLSMAYDLDKAHGGLIGLSNALTVNPNDWDRAIHANSIQVGLKLPRDYNDESLRLLNEKWKRQRGEHNS
jgi:hypothetical protein